MLLLMSMKLHKLLTNVSLKAVSLDFSNTSFTKYFPHLKAVCGVNLLLVVVIILAYD